MAIKRYLHWWTLFEVLIQRASASPPPAVGLSQPECQHKAEVLFCDYKNSKLDAVLLNSLEDDGLERVFIYNIRKLHLSDSACVNVTLHNIQEVVIADGNNICNKSVELAAKQCILESVPASINSLYLEECQVTSLTTSAELSKLTILNSVIKNMDITSSLVNGTKAVIQDSEVTSLNKLVAGSGSTLLIRKSTLHIKENSGLDIIASKVSIVDSTVKGPEGGVTLQPGGTLTIGNQQGEITVSGGECDDSEQGYIFMILFAVFLALFLMSLALNLLLVLHFTKLRKKPSMESITRHETIQKTHDVDKSGQCLSSKTDTDANKHPESVPMLKSTSNENTSQQVTKSSTEEVVDIDLHKLKRSFKMKDSELIAKIKAVIEKTYITNLHAQMELRFERINLTTSYRCSLYSGALSLAAKISKKEVRKTIKAEEFRNKESHQSKSVFSERETSLKLHLISLTTTQDEAFYKESFKINDELLPSFMKLSKTLKKKSEVHKALNHVADSLEKADLYFHLDLLNCYEEELLEIIDFLEIFIRLIQ